MLGSMTTRMTRPVSTITPPHASANGAFIDTSVRIKGSGSGPLAGLTFGAKDLFDVRVLQVVLVSTLVYRSRAPSLATATQPGKPPTRLRPPTPPLCRYHTHTFTLRIHHRLLQLLLDAGADLVGKTAMDELAYSLNGENAHYGTPVNPRCPQRVPGGSSSGSAVRFGCGHV